MKKVIVTGANGFVGTALCKELTMQGINVIAVVRDDKENVETIKMLPNIKIVFCDLAEIQYLDVKLEDRDIDVFYHLAWVGTSGGLRGDYHIQLNNAKYACDAAMVCRNIGCSRFIFASSIMEYELEKIVSEGKIPSINTLYSSGKIVADYMLRAVCGEIGVHYISALISNIYGPGEISQRLINTSIRKLLNGEYCAFSSGEQLYDFIYVDDAVKCFANIGERGIPNKTYYIGSLEPRPLKEFLLELRDIVKPEAEIGLGEFDFNGVSLSYKEFDVLAVKNDTGFVPEVTFKDGIKRTMDWLRSQKNV